MERSVVEELRREEILVEEAKQQKYTDEIQELSKMRLLLEESKHDNWSIKNENMQLKSQLKEYDQLILDIKGESASKLSEMREEIWGKSQELKMEKCKWSKYNDFETRLKCLQKDTKEDSNLLQLLKVQMSRPGLHCPTDNSNPLCGSSTNRPADDDCADIQRSQMRLHETLDQLSKDAQRRKGMLSELKRREHGYEFTKKEKDNFHGKTKSGY